MSKKEKFIVKCENKFGFTNFFYYLCINQHK